MTRTITELSSTNHAIDGDLRREGVIPPADATAASAVQDQTSYEKRGSGSDLDREDRRDEVPGRFFGRSDPHLRHETQPPRIGGRQKGLTAGIVPTLDLTKMLTSMFEFGASLLLVQQQVFAGILDTTTRLSDTNEPDANRPPVEPDMKTERELIAALAWEFAKSPRARGDVDNWLLAECDLRAAGRIAQA